MIDRALPKQGSRNLPHSIATKAMILNSLGFTHQRLYLFPNYFKTIPTEKLLGKDITPSSLNDDAIGRTLDAIYEFGPTELFNEITLHIMKTCPLGTQLIHVETTNFSVRGKYENDAPDGTDSIRITFGHAKDGRTDLKRFVLGLVTNQFGLPLLLRHSLETSLRSFCSTFFPEDPLRCPATCLLLGSYKVEIAQFYRLDSSPNNVHQQPSTEWQPSRLSQR